MCSRYEAPDADQLMKAFGVAPEHEMQSELWPGYTGPFLRAPQASDPDDEAAPSVESLTGMFGLLPFWAKDTKLARKTYNARSETADSKSSFRSAWSQGQHCYPRDGDLRARLALRKGGPDSNFSADGGLMSIAGLWEKWTNPDGETVHSYSMLTVNADDHPLMRNYHRQGSEKRMVVVLPNGALKDWLTAPASESKAFMRQYPADRLQAEPEPRP